jgi:two-component system NtrC family sensor kinase
MYRLVSLSRFVLLTAIAFCFNLSFAQSSTTALSDPILFKNDSLLLNISHELMIFEDKSKQMPFSEVIQQPFEKTKVAVPNFGISESVFWLKLAVKNETDATELMLNLSLPTLDVVDFYHPENNGYRTIIGGENYVFSKRKYQDPNYLFDLYIPKGDTKVYYLKIESKENIQLPMSIGTKKVIYDDIKSRDILSGIYFGIMLVMCLYNLFLFFSVRDKSYLLYVIYIVIILITQTLLQGYPFQYLWPNSPWVAQHSLFIFPSLVGIAGMEFMKDFLKVKFHSTFLHRLSFFLMIPYVVSIFCALIDQYKISYNIMEVNAMLVSIYMLSTAIYVLKRGFAPAKFFLIAWVVFLLGIVIYIMKDLEVLPFNNFTRYIMQIGSGLEVILLSFALADRINILRKEKEESQAQSLAISKENERIIREQNIILERTVEARTLELRNTNDDLNHAMQDLKNTQSQLVSAEKMASLGQLTAGIAHEINNPINFVTSSVKPLRQNISEILQILRKYEEINESSVLKEKLVEIEALKDELEMNYLLEEIEEIIESIDEGAQRTAEIVQGLRNFSHIDDIGIKENDINLGITSTIKLLKSELSDIKISKIFGELPKVECYGGKVNQVFLNIINNAVQAIKKSDNAQKGKIEIETTLENDTVKIVITDNGPGIPEDIREKIFDPFFTTKDVGEGTGLGLSVAYGIIDQHKGNVKVESEIGVGTKFIVILPVSQR